MNDSEKILHLERKVVNLESTVEKNAQILRTLSLVSNLIYKKLGITTKEVADALAEELQEYIKRSSKADSKQPTAPNDTGQREQSVSIVQSNGTPTGVPNGTEEVPKESSTGRSDAD